jgi:hypothetical protein
MPLVGGGLGMTWSTIKSLYIYSLYTDAEKYTDF